MVDLCQIVSIILALLFLLALCLIVQGILVAPFKTFMAIWFNAGYKFRQHVVVEVYY